MNTVGQDVTETSEPKWGNPLSEELLETMIEYIVELCFLLLIFKFACHRWWEQENEIREIPTFLKLDTISFYTVNVWKALMENLEGIWLNRYKSRFQNSISVPAQSAEMVFSYE